MGIATEFNPDLALRDYSEFKNGTREKEECIPENLKEGEIYEFLKKGQRIFWLTNSEQWNYGQMPLMKTQGNEKLSRPLASIKMIEVTHFLKNNEPFTKGKYKVIEVFNPKDSKINFESYKRIK